jgi:carbamoyl-phosphate synthase large subunit
VKRRLNILITAVSRRVTLVRAFRAALERAGVPGRVLVTDVNPLSPGVHVADGAVAVPLSTAPEYISTILDVCRSERVDLVVPTIDDELPVFAAAAETFGAEGIRVAVSSLDATITCNDKVRTCERLREAGVAAAASFLPADLPARMRPPLFIKPRAGRGSVGAFAVRTTRELEFFLDYVADPCVQEFLDGPEFTLDVFCDFAGVPLSVVPRERVVIRSGVIDRGRTVRDDRLIALGLACTEVFPFAGPINIQCRVHRGVPTVFEINPRFSGGIGLTIHAGADFPYWLVLLTLGRPVPPAIGAFADNLWMTSYESALFLARDAHEVLRPSPLPVEVPTQR